jgi:uncharacterized protein (TIGR02594 family)
VLTSRTLPALKRAGIVVLAAIFALAFMWVAAVFTAPQAHASPRHRHAKHHHHHHHVHRHNDAGNVWSRPAEWCGWFMRKALHVTDPSGNVALWWAHYGSPASGPGVGRIVVWSHGGGRGHVGIITGKNESGWIVKSGNDGNRVRERVRNVSNAVAFREP